jgi:hypothetical protein
MSAFLRRRHKPRPRRPPEPRQRAREAQGRLDPLALSRPPLMRVPARWARRHLLRLLQIARARRRVILLQVATGVVLLIPCLGPGRHPPPWRARRARALARL